MNKYYFEDDSSKFEEFSIEPFGWFLSMESDEIEYLKFLEFKKKYPEEDYEF
jgi:hypothetical protein